MDKREGQAFLDDPVCQRESVEKQKNRKTKEKCKNAGGRLDQVSSEGRTKTAD